MRLTDRDVRLVKDVALSHVHSRDALVRLCYFGSVTRANARLLSLREAGYLRVLDTPFHGGHLYAAGARAREIVGERIAALITGRAPSPRFLRHALSVTEIRIALLARGGEGWRYEPQLRHAFRWRGEAWEVRPDGLVRLPKGPVMIECDLGNVSRGKFAAKLAAYRAYAQSGEAEKVYGPVPSALLTVTTGERRLAELRKLAPADAPTTLWKTFGELGIAVPGGWS